MTEKTSKKINEMITKRQNDVDNHARSIFQKQKIVREINEYYHHCLFINDFKIKFLKDWDVTSQGKTGKKVMQSIFEVAKQYISQVEKGEKVHAVFWGQSGRGKSWLANIIMCELVKKRKKCLFLNAILLKRMFENKQEKERYMKYIKGADLVVIDELGAESNMKNNNSEATNDWQQELYSIFSICENKNLIVTTNYSPEDLRLTYNPNICSRIEKNLNNTGNKKYKSFRINFNLSELRYDLRFERGSIKK